MNDAEVLARIEARFGQPVYAPSPRPMTGRELRAKAGRDARSAAANARKAACQHPKWRRVYADPLGIRCASCGAVKQVSADERNRLAPKPPGQPAILYPFRGENLTIYDLAKRFNLNARTIHDRMTRIGMSLEAAVSCRSSRKPKVA